MILGYVWLEWKFLLVYAVLKGSWVKNLSSYIGWKIELTFSFSFSLWFSLEAAYCRAARDEIKLWANHEPRTSRLKPWWQRLGAHISLPKSEWGEVHGPFCGAVRSSSRLRTPRLRKPLRWTPLNSQLKNRIPGPTRTTTLIWGWSTPEVASSSHHLPFLFSPLITVNLWCHLLNTITVKPFLKGMECVM